MNTLQRDAMGETFVDLEEHIIKVAVAFWGRYGGDLDVIKQDARFHFVKAFELWRPDKRCSMKTWVCMRIRYQLLETHRAKVFRSNRLKRIGLDTDTMPNRRQFSLEELQLSDDAEYVARIVLDPTPGMLLTIASETKDTPTNLPKNLQTAAVQFLEDIGWGIDRIKESFEEIRRAL